MEILDNEDSLFGQTLETGFLLYQNNMKNILGA